MLAKSHSLTATFYLPTVLRKGERQEEGREERSKSIDKYEYIVHVDGQSVLPAIVFSLSFKYSLTLFRGHNARNLTRTSTLMRQRDHVFRPHHNYFSYFLGVSLKLYYDVAFSRCHCHEAIKKRHVPTSANVLILARHCF